MPHIRTKCECKIWKGYSRYLNPFKMRLHLTLLFVIVLQFCYGQSGNYPLQIISSDKPKEFFSKKFSYRTQCKDSIQAKREGKDLFEKLRSFGYLSASIDSVTVDSVRA